jgi:hypothetical protein
MEEVNGVGDVVFDEHAPGISSNQGCGSLAHLIGDQNVGSSSLSGCADKNPPKTAFLLRFSQISRFTPVRPPSLLSLRFAPFPVKKNLQKTYKFFSGSVAENGNPATDRGVFSISAVGIARRLYAFCRFSPGRNHASRQPETCAADVNLRGCQAVASRSPSRPQGLPCRSDGSRRVIGCRASGLGCG